MVIGNGLLATYFKQYQKEDSFLIFASGVSNSKTNNTADFEREEKLLRQHIAQSNARCFVYFSTCSISDPDLCNTPYVLHKQAMERLISQNSECFCIFRLSNVVGTNGNPNTILNFLFHNILRNQKIDIWKNSDRNLIDVVDVFAIVNYILVHNMFRNTIINIANPKNYSVLEIVAAIENFLNKKGNYDIVEKGGTFTIDVSNIKPIIEKLGILKESEKIETLLEKYYQSGPISESI